MARADHAQGLLFETHKGMVPEEVPAAPAAAAEEQQGWQNDADSEVQDVHDVIDDAEDGVCLLRLLLLRLRALISVRVAGLVPGDDPLELENS